MSTTQSPNSQPEVASFIPKGMLPRLALGGLLWVELHFAVTRSWYDIRTRDLLHIVFVFLAVRMVAQLLPQGLPRGLAAWLRAVSAVLLLIVGEFALLMKFSPLTWTPFALGVGSLTAAVLVAWLRIPPDRRARSSGGSH